MDSVILKKLSVFKAPIKLRVYIRNGEGINGFIEGVVTERSIPVSRKVCCYHRLSNELLSIVRSSDSGRYRFDGLIAGSKYYITSLDEDEDGAQYNAVTQDLITASEVTA